MIEFTNEKRFIAFWFVYPPHEGLRDRRTDWFCGSWLNPDGTLEFHYRFHYYDEPEDPSEGERSWYAMKSKTAVDDAGIADHIKITSQLAQLNVMRNGGAKMDFIECKGCNGEEAVALLKQKKWFHEKSGQMYQETL